MSEQAVHLVGEHLAPLALLEVGDDLGGRAAASLAILGCTGTTPGQLLANLLPFMIKKFGKKIYVLAADYNFGQLSEKWTRKIAKENGAEVIASEFFPLDVSQFGPTIGKIQAAKFARNTSFLFGGSRRTYRS